MTEKWELLLGLLLAAIGLGVALWLGARDSNRWQALHDRAEQAEARASQLETADDLQKEEYAAEIRTLKQSLADTDYKAIKYAEGVMTDEDYQATGIQRQAWRRRINELEELING